MAHNLKHVPDSHAIGPYEGRLPITRLRAEALASCTLNATTAARYLRETPRSSRAAAWCQASYLMRTSHGAWGWRLTAAGEDALRLAFVAVCEGWPVCIMCGRQKPGSAFLSKTGKRVKTCSTCVLCKEVSGLR